MMRGHSNKSTVGGVNFLQPTHAGFLLGLRWWVSLRPIWKDALWETGILGLV